MKLMASLLFFAAFAAHADECRLKATPTTADKGGNITRDTGVVYGNTRISDTGTHNVDPGHITIPAVITCEVKGITSYDRVNLVIDRGHSDGGNIIEATWSTGTTIEATAPYFMEGDSIGTSMGPRGTSVRFQIVPRGIKPVINADLEQEQTISRGMRPHIHQVQFTEAQFDPVQFIQDQGAYVDDEDGYGDDYYSCYPGDPYFNDCYQYQPNVWIIPGVRLHGGYPGIRGRQFFGFHGGGMRQGPTGGYGGFHGGGHMGMGHGGGRH